MNKYSFTNNGKTWERITKKQARAAYNNGLTVLFCPVNMRRFWVKTKYYGIIEMYALNKTDIRKELKSNVIEIMEVKKN